MDRKEYNRQWRAGRTPEQKKAESARKAAWYASLTPEQKKEIGSRPHRRSEKAKQRKRERTRDDRLKKEYGMTYADKQRMLELQGGKCANSGCNKVLLTDRDKHVDHNHETGKVRAVLCNNCNVALGLLKDDDLKLTGLLRYLEKHSALDRQF